MSDLPESWVRAPLGDLIASIVGGGTPSKAIQENFRGTIPFMTVKDMHGRFVEDTQDHITEKALSESASTVVPADTLIVASRMSLGKIARPKVPVAINQDLKALFLHEGVDRTYVEYAWRANASTIRERGTGTTVKGIRLEDIRGLEVSVAPAREQTRIADQLDTLLARIQACNDGLDAIPALLKRFRRAVLSSAVRGQLTEDWRGSGRAQASLKGHALWSVPEGWRWVTAGDECGFITKGTTPPKEKMHSAVGEVPYIKVYNLTFNGVLNFTIDPTFVDERTHRGELKRSIALPGDVLMNIVGPPLGKVSVVPTTHPEWNINQAIARFRPGPSLRSDYLAACLLSPELVDYAVSKAKATAGQWNLTLEICRGLPIPVPSLEEQDEVVRRIRLAMRQAARIESHYAAAASHLQRLTPLTLAKAFRGELVQQDVNDEPASVLLQRIAKTPATAVKTQRGRPRPQQPNEFTTRPAMQPDRVALPDGAWAASGQPDEHATTAQLIAVLKAWGEPMPQDQVRLAAALCLQPRLFTAALPAQDAASWRRLVGDEAEPLPASVAALQPAVNTHWRRALAGLRTRGDLMVSRASPQDTWALGPGADRVDTAGWPDGRAGWVAAYLRAHGVEALLPLLSPAAVDFVHARAA